MSTFHGIISNRIKDMCSSAGIRSVSQMTNGTMSKYSHSTVACCLRPFHYNKLCNQNNVVFLIKAAAIIKLFEGLCFLTLFTMLNYFCINHGDHRDFQFEIIINVLFSFSCFICIAMLWVYSHYK